MPNPSSTPIAAPGARVELALESVTLVCRLQAVDGELMHLVLPDGARSAVRSFRAGRARLTVFRSHGLYQAESDIRDWAWGHPARVVVGPVEAWARRCRRWQPRRHCVMEARVVTGEGEVWGHTRDFSREGLALTVRVPPAAEPSGLVHVRLRLGGGWSRLLPAYVERMRRRLDPSGMVYEVGLRMGAHHGMDAMEWQHCLTLTGVDRVS